MESVSALSAPKGVKFICDLTGGPANVALVTPMGTKYYGSKQEAVISWEGIMHKLMPLIGPLEEKTSSISSEEERVKRDKIRKQGKKDLITLTHNVAESFLVQGQYDLALAGAVQSLKYAQEVYGKDSIELVPAYLLLAQSSLGTKNFRQTQEYLGYANWSVLQASNPSLKVKSQLERTFGKNFAAQGKFQEASQHFAQDIYWMSLESGPEHVDAAPGYFHLASVFDAQNRIESSLALYDKVVDIWYKYLTTIRVAGEKTQQLEAAQCEESLQMLVTILKAREQFLGENHIVTGEAQFTLGLMRLLIGKDKNIAKTNLSAAQSIYMTHLGPDHPSTVDVGGLLELLEQ